LANAAVHGRTGDRVTLATVANEHGAILGEDIVVGDKVFNFGGGNDCVALALREVKVVGKLAF